MSWCAPLFLGVKKMFVWAGRLQKIVKKEGKESGKAFLIAVEDWKFIKDEYRLSIYKDVREKLSKHLVHLC